MEDEISASREALSCYLPGLRGMIERVVSCDEGSHIGTLKKFVNASDCHIHIQGANLHCTTKLLFFREINETYSTPEHASPCHLLEWCRHVGLLDQSSETALGDRTCRPGEAMIRRRGSEWSVQVYYIQLSHHDQNRTPTDAFSSSPIIPDPANVHFSLTMPSVTDSRNRPLCA